MNCIHVLRVCHFILACFGIHVVKKGLKNEVQVVHSTYANILKNKYKKVRKNVGIG
jgi:hypothetical protein